jgi:hypothetical protein
MVYVGNGSKRRREARIGPILSQPYLRRRLVSIDPDRRFECGVTGELTLLESSGSTGENSGIRDFDGTP